MYLKNDKGITLIEVLISIVILTIILATVINFFPQMALSNNFNIEKNQAVQLAKKELIDWQNVLKTYYDSFHENLPNIPEFTFIERCSESMISDECPPEVEYTSHLFETDDDRFVALVSVKKESDINTEPNKVHQIHIQIRDKEDYSKMISETYGYVIRN